MGKRLFISIIIILFIIIIGCYFLGFLNPLNKYFVYSTPDKTCNIDSDCRLFKLPQDDEYCKIDCSITNIYDFRLIAVNKNWKVICIFPDSLFKLSDQCVESYDPPLGYSVNSQCINNQCEKIIDKYSTGV